MTEVNGAYLTEVDSVVEVLVALRVMHTFHD